MNHVPVALHHLIAAQQPAQAMGIPVRTYSYNMCRAELDNGSTRFQAIVPHNTDTASILAIEIRTTDPPPPLETLLADLGHLRVSIVSQSNPATNILSVPAALICALGTVDYVGTRLTIRCDFNMFFDRIKLINISWGARLSITLTALSLNYVTNVSFLVRGAHHDTDERRAFAMDPNNITPIQQIDHQTVQSLVPAQHFTFEYELDRLTKGFFIEGGIQDISSARFTMSNGQDLWNYYATELATIGRDVGGKYLFVPFNDQADLRSNTAYSFVGGFTSRDPVQLTVTYNALRPRASAHALTSNTLRYHGGVATLASQHPDIIINQLPGVVRTSQIPEPVPAIWTRTERSLDPERNVCPISYETITGDFCECEQCHHAFTATAFQTYAETRRPLICPMCRAPWITRVIYTQPTSDLTGYQG